MNSSCLTFVYKAQTNLFFIAPFRLLLGLLLFLLLQNRQCLMRKDSGSAENINISSTKCNQQFLAGQVDFEIK
jgi:hypothetical protein